MNGFPWNVLGIGETSDKGAIRRAYSARLKELDLDKQIAEYAQLREARDEALWLAANPPQEDDDFGLGSLDDDDFGDFEDAPVPATYDGDDDFDWEIRESELADGGYGGDLSLGTRPGELDPFLSRREEPKLPDGWAELAALVFPGGMQSNEPFTPQEADEADAALDRLIAWAEEGDLERETTLDHNLAEMLAGGWPRSAPVVDKANTAFHWLGEAGGLDERPALQFLNARTQGMRFHDAVLVRGHPLHKAWIELSTPGKVSWFQKMKTKHEDIHDLLAIIRSRFPELESLLDAERVQSWEAPAKDAVSSGVQWFFVALLLSQLLRLCAVATDDTVSPEQIVATSITLEELDAAALSAFGGDYSYATLLVADARFARQFREFVHVPGSPYRPDPRILVRRKIVGSRSLVDDATLLEIQALRLAWMRAASAVYPDDCANVLDESFNGARPEMGAASVEKEQELARRLLSEGVFSDQPEPQRSRLVLPDRVIAAASQRSSLSEARFRQELPNRFSPYRCEVEIAILEALLASRGDEDMKTLRSI